MDNQLNMITKNEHNRKGQSGIHSLATFLGAWLLVRELRPPAFVRSLAPDELGLDCEPLPKVSLCGCPQTGTPYHRRLASESVGECLRHRSSSADGSPEPPRCSLIEEPRAEELMTRAGLGPVSLTSPCPSHRRRGAPIKSTLSFQNIEAALPPGIPAGEPIQ